jgi:hypothetical protein
MIVYCESTFCESNKNGRCELEIVYFKYQTTGGGLVLMCQDDTDKG